VTTQTSLFKGRMVAVATTDRRLIAQGMTRKLESDGEPISCRPTGSPRRAPRAPAAAGRRSAPRSWTRPR
jgi:hypothetical protein